MSCLFVTCLLVCTGCIQTPSAGKNLGENAGQLSQSPPSILTQVPDVRQSQSYSCGAASLQAVFNYWGIDEREGMLIQELNSTEETGTPPESLVRVARAHGLHAYMLSNLTLADLEQFNANGTPVIIACQAWRTPEEENQSWDNLWDDGHYMVVIGLDKDNVYFEDPSLLGSRGFIPRQEFLSRWHDYEGTSLSGPNSTVFSHLGIIIRGNEPAVYPTFTYVD